MKYDLLNDNVAKVYRSYLAAAFGSAMISSIYSIVDMAMVGQYSGEVGTAALAVVAPLWNIIYALGLLFGIGGAVLFSIRKGTGRGGENEYFTAAFAASVLFSLITWLLVIFFDEKIIMLFGGKGEIVTCAREYFFPIKFTFPLFLFNQMLAAFLRCDNSPELATYGVLAGGVFNVFGDYFFTFALDMGVFGAGLATALGALITFLFLLSHFFLKKNTLRLVKVEKLPKTIAAVTKAGLSSFIVDVSMGFMTIIMNRQIMIHLGQTALAIYGPIINISTIVTCTAYAIGQASQPIISTNYGAGRRDRVNEVLRLGVITSFIFAFFFTLIMELFPLGVLSIFLKLNEGIRAIAPFAIRAYSLSFILLPLNVYSTYYLQSINRANEAFIISIMRGILINGALAMILPFMNGNMLWLTMTFTEAITAIYVICQIKISAK